MLSSYTALRLSSRIPQSAIPPDPFLVDACCSQLPSKLKVIPDKPRVPGDNVLHEGPTPDCLNADAGRSEDFKTTLPKAYLLAKQAACALDEGQLEQALGQVQQVSAILETLLRPSKQL
jgi:hypothetical protein